MMYPPHLCRMAEDRGEHGSNTKMHVYLIEAGLYYAENDNYIIYIIRQMRIYYVIQKLKN